MAWSIHAYFYRGCKESVSNLLNTSLSSLLQMPTHTGSTFAHQGQSLSALCHVHSHCSSAEPELGGHWGQMSFSTAVNSNPWDEVSSF